MKNIYTQYLKKLSATSFVLLILSFFIHAEAGEILIGTGTSTTGATGPPFSMASGYSYSASEQIYTGTEVGQSGWISEIGFYKQSGNSDPVYDVSIYLKSTSNTEVGTLVDTSGYILVYNGPLPNSTTGWVSVPLSSAFSFQHETSNLAVLVVKGNQSGSGNYPAYRRVATAKANGASYYRSSGTAWSPGTTMTRASASSNYRSQLRLVLTSCSVAPEVTDMILSGNQAEISFSCPSCTGNYIIEYGLSGFAPGSTGSAGEGTVISTSSHSATITGLTQGATYDVYVRNNCTGSDFSINSAKATFTTSCGIYSLPFSENFNSVTAPALPFCFSIENTNGGAEWITTSLTSNRLYINTSTEANDWLFIPALYLEAGKTYRLQFNYRTGVTSTGLQRFKVHYGNSNNSASATYLLADYNGINTNTGTSATQTIYFTPASNGVQYIGFHAYSAGLASGYIAIDDIDVRLSPEQCLPPATVSAVPTSDVSANLSWTAPVASLPSGYEWEVRTNTSAGNATGRIASGTTAHPSLTATVQTLSASTTYYLYVRTSCSGNGNSSWLGSATFTTPCAAVSVPYTENFSSTTGSNLPTCTSTQGTAWTTANVSSNRVLQYLRTYNQYANGYFFTRGINLQADKTYRLKFLYRGSTTSGVLNFRAQAATWADSSHLIPGSIFEGSATSSTSNQEASGTFTPSISGIYYLSFHAYSQTTSPSVQNYLYIDDISFEEFPECSQPQNQPTALSLTPSYNTVTGTFTPSTGGADQYLVIRTIGTDIPDNPQNWQEYTPGTYDLGGYIEHSGSVTSFTSNYLDLNTSYSYWIFAYNHSSCANGPVYLTDYPLNALTTTLSCTSYATKTFTNTVSNQNVNRNWSAIAWTPSGLPGPCDNVIITHATTGSYSLNITVDVPVHVHHLDLVASYGTATNSRGFDLIGNASSPFIIDGNLTISGTSGSPTNSETEFYSQGGNIIVKGNAVFGSDNDPVHIAFGRSGGSPVFEFRGNVTFAGQSYTRSNGQGTWLFDGNGTQTITNNSVSAYNWPNPGATPAISFQNVTIGSLHHPTVTLAGTKTTYLRGGDLLINSGSTLSIPDGQSLNQEGSNAGAFALFDGAKLKLGGTSNGFSTGNNFPHRYALHYLEPNSTIEYNGIQTQTLAPFVYGNLTVNNQDDIHVPDGVSIQGSLSFQNGKLIADEHPLFLTGTATVSGAGLGKYVEGYLTKEISSPVSQKTFEVGNALSYTPLAIDFFGNINSGGNITVKSTEGIHPEILSSGLSDTKYVNAYWDVNSTSVSGVDSLRLTFQYHSEDLAGSSAPENLIAAGFSNGSWTSYPTSVSGIHQNRATGILQPQGSFILAELLSEECEALTDASTAASLPLVSSSSLSESCEINDNTWNYFKDAAGNIIAAINANGQDLGAVTLEVTLDEHNGPFAGNQCTGQDEYYLGRRYSVRSDKKAEQPVSFRLFFTDSEYQLFKTQVEGTDNNYKVCFGSTVSFEDLAISAFFAGEQNAVAVSNISKSANGPQGSYQFEFSILPVTGNGSENGRFDSDGTTFYIHGSGGTGAVLPVELTSFTATFTSPNIGLQWTTASEKNNDRFEILKSHDGIHFEKIGEVAGSGNSSVPLTYRFTDPNAETDRVYYYRLRQVDFDGAFELSKIISVETKDTSGVVVGLFYPNPTQKHAALILTLPSDNNKISIALYSAEGRLVKTHQYNLSKGKHLLDLDISALISGSYVSQIQINQQTIHRIINIIQ